jgi:hypothetical protein
MAILRLGLEFFGSYIDELLEDIYAYSFHIYEVYKGMQL